MKYAHREIERRFLVPSLPEDLGAGTLIEDRYLSNLRIRLRRMTGRDGEIFKLTQKIPEATSTNLNTTFYLTEAEYAYLKTLPGHDLQKIRYRNAHAGKTWAIDIFAGDLTGLILAEIETDPAENLKLPYFLGQEVTEDERFGGGNLARNGTP